MVQVPRIIVAYIFNIFTFLIFVTMDYLLDMSSGPHVFEIFQLKL